MADPPVAFELDPVVAEAPAPGGLETATPGSTSHAAPAAPPTPANAGGPTTGDKPAAIDNTLRLVTGGKNITGWLSVSVTRGIERVPSHFDISVTEKYPGGFNAFCKPGADCKVYIGSDLVLSGWIDRYEPGYTHDSHKVQVRGRSKVQDLVDCAAQYDGNQIPPSTLLQIATRLAQPYGITVQALDGDGPVTPQFNIVIGETAWEVIETVARFSQQLVYDGPDGNLILAQVGKRSMASGFQEGINVEAAEVSYSVDERYAKYEVYLLSTDPLRDGGVSSPVLGTATDSNIRSTRVRRIVSEQTMEGRNIQQERADWEKARRYGRSQSVRLTVDSWRDRAGKLWEPNTRALIQLPTLKVTAAKWVISEVTYRRGDDGEHADLVLMPPEAFTPEPTLIQTFDAQVARELGGGNAAPPNQQQDSTPAAPSPLATGEQGTVTAQPGLPGT